MEQQETLRLMRVELDGVYELLIGLNAVDRELRNKGLSPELEQAAGCVRMGKAWLGQLQGYSGGTSPYATEDGNRQTVENILPTADSYWETNKENLKPQEHLADDELVFTGLTFGDWKNKTQIARIDFIREALKRVESELDQIGQLSSREASSSRTMAWGQIKEGRMALGYELARIRKNAGR